MSLISNLNSKSDDLIELNRESFKKDSNFSFNRPKKGGGNSSDLFDNSLFNKKEISEGVISRSTR